MEIPSNQISSQEMKQEIWAFSFVENMLFVEVRLMKNLLTVWKCANFLSTKLFWFQQERII